MLEVLSKVVGVSDLYLWRAEHKEFEEVAVKTEKSILTGDKDADKDKVAAALPAFVGEQSYECDDESDAVAVAIAWLLVNGLIDGGAHG